MYCIVFSQIECGSIWAPPHGCLEYFTGTSGTIKTWNYDDTNNIHPSDAAYAICYRREKGYCGLAMTPADESNSFTFGGGNAFTTNGRNADGCAPDALSFPQASSTGAMIH